MTEKKKTAAEEYAELRQKQFDTFLEKSHSADALKNVDLFEVTVPTGMKFKCRRLGMDYFNHVGELPMHLVASSTLSETTKDQEAAFDAMTIQEKAEAIKATVQMVYYVTVEPRVMPSVNGHRNAIAMASLTMDDFNTLAAWAKGGAESGGTKTFRRKRK